jgi:uncharacterized DUF497 family protein
MRKGYLDLEKKGYVATFEYDLRKSDLNRRKHGIDFVSIQKVWIERVIQLRSHYEKEERMLVIGHIGEKFWTVVITLRNGVIRIISARRAREYEIKIWKNDRQ